MKALVDDVEVLVETQIPNAGGWQPRPTERFEPKVRHPWPLEFRLDLADDRRIYQVTATARDSRRSVVAEVRAIREPGAIKDGTILLVFEAACVRRMELCLNGDTCHSNQCVNAHYEAKFDPSSESDGGAVHAEDAGPDPGGLKVASEGEPCAPAGARACTGESSRVPLACVDASWTPLTTCAEDALCDTSTGALRGTCRNVAPECLGHDSDVPFCDRDTMRVCKTMFSSEVHTCGSNERCVVKANEATCDCMTGFANTGAGCEGAHDCTVENGGCDRLTTCSMSGSERKCSLCPEGYVGQGDTGCEPLLGNLSASVGQLSPTFDPAMHSYRLKVPLLAQSVTLTPSAPSAMRIELNGTPVAASAGWATPTLQLGEYPVKLRLTSSSGSTSDYDVIIERSGAQQAYVKASNVGQGDDFGLSVAISGDTFVVGAWYEDSAAKTIDGDQSDNSSRDSGAAYVFVRRGDTWEQQAYLKPTDSASQDFFGATVAIDGDTIVVGAICDDILGLTGAAKRPGAAYVFTRSQGHWAQAAKLAPKEGAAGDQLGFAVGLDGDTIAVGAPRDAGSGAAYVFTRVDGDWREQQKLKAEPAVTGANFGSAIAVSKDTLLVGSSNDDTEMSDAGSAHVFVRSGDTWALQQRLVAAPITSGANFGYALALYGDDALIGAPRVVSIATPVMTSPGEVFAYHRTGESWQQTQRLQAMLPRSSDSFGSSVALTHDAALIGACGDASGATGVGADASRRDSLYSGAAYLFARESEQWALSTYLKPSNTDTNDSFGFAAALSSDTAVVGALWESSNSPGVNGNGDDDSLASPGAVYVFR